MTFKPGDRVIWAGFSSNYCGRVRSVQGNTLSVDDVMEQSVVSTFPWMWRFIGGVGQVYVHECAKIGQDSSGVVDGGVAHPKRRAK